MFRRLFLFLCLAAFSMPLQAAGTACLSSSLADLWKLAGGNVDITVQEAVDRGFASPDAIIVDSSSGRSINSELIISADPDLTIGSVDTLSHVRLKGFMDGIGKRMLLLCLDSFDDFLSAFRELTEITGRDDLLQLSLIPSLYLFLQTLSADYSLVPVVSCFIGLLALAFANFWMRPLWRRL